MKVSATKSATSPSCKTLAVMPLNPKLKKITMIKKENQFANNGMTKEELKELASQLGNPDGEKGIQVGQMMNETNIAMTRSGWQDLSLTTGDIILELGHGNANHLEELLNKVDNLTYFGLDISETMKSEAEKYCLENNLSHKTSFQIYDGQRLPFKECTFDKIFTVNTIYFWQSPLEFLNEISRVLKPNGLFTVVFTDEETMNKLSFTEFGFTKYTDTKFEELVRQSNFELIIKKNYIDIIKSKILTDIEREYWVMTLTKGTNS